MKSVATCFSIVFVGIFKFKCQLKDILSSLNLSNKVYEEWHPAALGVMNANKKLGLKGGFKRF